MVKVDQSKVDQMFHSKFLQDPLEFPEACNRIKSVLELKYGIRLSTVEAAAFWRWRSMQYDAGWLTIGSDIRADNEIIEWFDKYFNEFWEEGE